jgi:hypothetical protein
MNLGQAIVCETMPGPIAFSNLARFWRRCATHGYTCIVAHPVNAAAFSDGPTFYGRGQMLHFTQDERFTDDIHRIEPIGERVDELTQLIEEKIRRTLNNRMPSGRVCVRHRDTRVVACYVVFGCEVTITSAISCSS